MGFEWLGKESLIHLNRRLEQRQSGSVCRLCGADRCCVACKATRLAWMSCHRWCMSMIWHAPSCRYSRYSTGACCQIIPLLFQVPAHKENRFAAVSFDKGNRFAAVSFDLHPTAALYNVRIGQRHEESGNRRLAVRSWKREREEGGVCWGEYSIYQHSQDMLGLHTAQHVRRR